jgi:hypothetical protein
MSGTLLVKIGFLYLVVLVVTGIGYGLGLSAVTALCVGFIAAFGLNLALTIFDAWSRYRS